MRYTRTGLRALLLSGLTLALVAPPARAEAWTGEKTLTTLEAYFDVTVEKDSVRRERLGHVFGVDTSKVIKILVFDHAEITWSAYCWDGSSRKIKAAQELLGRTPEGTPKLIREPDDQFLLFVLNTNPFLYSRQSTVLPPVEASSIANMKALASAIGSLVPGGVLAPLSQEAAKRLTDARSTIAALPDLQQQMTLFVQELEFGKNVKEPTFTPARVDEATKSVLEGFDELTALHARLVGTVKGCTAQWVALGSLLQRVTISDDDLKTARAELYKAGSASPGTCVDPTPRDLLESLISAKTPDEREKTKNDLAEKLPVNDALRLLRVEDALGQRKSAEAALAQLTNFVRVADRATLGVANPAAWDAPLLTSGVAIMNPSFESQHWDKDYPGTLAIANDPSLCADCGRIRPVVDKTSYLLTSRRDAFLGVGFGATFTTIDDPTYGKVSVDPTGQVKGNVIGLTAEDSRSGLLAILGIIRPWPLIDRTHRRGIVEPGIEFGAGVDPKKPAGFLGVSFEFWKVARLGIGGTWQSVTTLGEGLTAAKYGPDGRPLPGTGSPVSVDGDIRTHKRVTGRLYLSLVLGLDSLPFFEPKKN